MAAFDTDFLTRVVNVNWGEAGTVFVASGSIKFPLYAKVKNKDELSGTATDLFDALSDMPDYNPDTDYLGAGSYKKVKNKPTLILGGNDLVVDEDTGGRGSGAVIMMSHDGKNWTRIFRKQWPDQPINDAHVRAFAWDKNMFYGYVLADDFYYILPDGGTPPGQLHSKTYERSLISSSGESWSEAGQILRRDSAPVDGEPPPTNLDPPALFMPHLNSISNRPDGTFGYYEKRNDEDEITESYLVMPTDIDEYWYLNEQAPDPKPSVDITIVKPDEGGIPKKTRATKATPIKVICAAYAAGIIMVGGQDTAFRATIAASVDDGDTWEIVWRGADESEQQINTIIAAPLSDIANTA